jgi:putative membrane protein
MLRKNVIKGILGGSVVALLAAALVHAQTTDPQAGSTAATTGTQGAGTTGTTASGSGSSSATLSRADRKIIMDLAQANMSEIETGRLAQSKSQNEQVKNYAQQMIDDHTKALSDVQQLAQARNITLATQLDRTNKAKLNRLGGLSGEAFDRAYMERAAVADHKKTHDMLRQAQSRAKDAEVKALVARTLPIVDQHLTSGQQLHKDTTQGSSRTQGTTGSSTDKKNE